MEVHQGDRSTRGDTPGPKSLSECGACDGGSEVDRIRQVRREPRRWRMDRGCCESSADTSAGTGASGRCCNASNRRPSPHSELSFIRRRDFAEDSQECMEGTEREETKCQLAPPSPCSKPVCRRTRSPYLSQAARTGAGANPQTIGPEPAQAPRAPTRAYHHRQARSHSAPCSFLLTLGGRVERSSHSCLGVEPWPSRAQAPTAPQPPARSGSRGFDKATRGRAGGRSSPCARLRRSAP